MVDEWTDAVALAASHRGSVVAAAGCGKTELIAQATARAEGRQLVLTHTNAGVEAIRRRMRRLGVQGSGAAVDTLDGWCLRYVSAYPRLCGGVPVTDEDEIDWNELRKSMLRLLERAMIHRVLRASYGGALVDEYQDCDATQHSLVVALANVLPTRVLGDPLQGVFRFNGEPPPWDAVVETAFPRICRLDTPWRWRKEGSNKDLGDWLTEARLRLERGMELDLRDPRIRHVSPPRADKWAEAARDVCFDLSARGGTVVAICKWPSDRHLLGKVTGGAVQCIEPVEAKDGASFLLTLETREAVARPGLILGFLRRVAVGLGEQTQAIEASVQGGEPIDDQQFRAAVDALRRVRDGGNGTAIAVALELLCQLPGAKVFRRELVWAVSDALRASADDQLVSAVTAFKRARNMTSHRGRRLPRCCVGSTLLTKGLEFDHAVVAVTNQFTLYDLYVGLTRASRSLTVLNLGALISPRALAAQ